MTGLCSGSSSRIKEIVSCKKKNKVKIKTAPYISTPKGGGYGASDKYFLCRSIDPSIIFLNLAGIFADDHPRI
jgi:hypothetical protein